jgi:hypothetical protein
VVIGANHHSGSGAIVYLAEPARETCSRRSALIVAPGLFGRIALLLTLYYIPKIKKKGKYFLIFTIAVSLNSANSLINLTA